MEDKYLKLKSLINLSNSIVVFTGAGISVPSGIPDFRSATGVFSEKTKTGYRPEEVVSHSFFMAYPDEFYKFYKEKMCYENAKPNAAHKYFADLEKKGKNVTVVTQNIDGLHQAAGSSRVYELHGSIHRNYCMECNAFYNLDQILRKDGVPHCDRCGGIIKPDVVLYEEGLDSLTVEYAISAIMTADLMVIIGTSLRVYPAASYIRYFKGKAMVLINKGNTGYNNMCDLVFDEDVIEVIKKIS